MFELIKYVDFFKSYIRPQAPSYLILFVTARCNLNCKMCFYWKRIKKNNNKNELTLNEIEAISQSFGYLLNLAISGGEPFLRDDLDRICYIFYRNNNLRFMNIPTNGSMPERIESTTEKILQLCREAVVAIELSLDGIGPMHDFIRGEKGSFEKLKNTYQKLIRLKKEYSNLWLKVSTTFSFYNQNSLEEIINYVKTQMQQVDDFHIAMLHGDPRDQKTKEFALEKYSYYIKLLETKKITHRRSLLGRALYAIRKEATQDTIDVMRRGRFFSSCTAIDRIIVINEEGDVFPCETITEKIGNLRESNYNIYEIIHSEKRYLLEKKYKMRSLCHCNWGCAIFNNILYDYKRIPSLVKNFIF